MKFVLEIECDNAAFDEDPVPEVIRILAETVGKLADGGRSVVLVDSNGNSVGRAEFVETAEACTCTYGAYVRHGGGTACDIVEHDPLCPEHGEDDGGYSAPDDESPWGSFPEERGHHDLVGTPHAQAHAEVERRRREGGGA